MFLQKKAIYNLIQLNLHHDEVKETLMSQLQPWQFENYRKLSTDELFSRLKLQGFNLTPEDFATLAHQFDTPEEMSEECCTQRDSLEKDYIYLLFFELWRRLFPEKRTISIFCDELDNQMMNYDLNLPNEIGPQLFYLQQILDEHVDKGLQPLYAFGVLQTYCAVDIESFLFDFILNHVQANESVYAEELLDGFSPYMQQVFWFKYLKARTDIIKDPEDGYETLEKIIRSTKEEHLPLMEEILYFLANSGNHSLFHLLANKNLGFMKQEDEFHTFLEACLAHYSFLELTQPVGQISEILSKRRESQNLALQPDDKDLVFIHKLINQPLQFASDN